MTMTATVLRVNPGSLLVRDEATGEEVLVNTRSANRFSTGDRVRITHRGQMTFSIPPQITATSIQRLGGGAPEFFPPPAPPPQSALSEMRAIVLQRGRNFLMVQNTQTRQQFRVDYAFAHHFCVRQQVIVRYDTLTLENPPRVTAIDINPVC